MPFSDTLLNKEGLALRIGEGTRLLRRQKRTATGPVRTRTRRNLIVSDAAAEMLPARSLYCTYTVFVPAPVLSVHDLLVE